MSSSRGSAATCAARVPAVSPNGSGPANLATIRAAVTAVLKDAGYLHIPDGRRDHTTSAETLRPPRPRLGQKRTFTEHAGALTPNSIVIKFRVFIFTLAARLVDRASLASCRGGMRAGVGSSNLIGT